MCYWGMWFWVNWNDGECYPQMAELLRLVNCEAIQPDRNCVIGRCAHIHYANAVHPIFINLQFWRVWNIVYPCLHRLNFLAKLLFMALALAHEYTVSNRKKSGESRLSAGIRWIKSCTLWRPKMGVPLWRDRRQGPGGSMKHQFHPYFLNICLNIFSMFKGRAGQGNPSLR